MHDTILVQSAFTLLGLLGENVAFKRFLVSDLSCAGYFKPFFGTGVSLYFRHDLSMFYFYTLLAFRTGGHLWSLVGNPAYAGNGRQK